MESRIASANLAEVASIAAALAAIPLDGILAIEEEEETAALKTFVDRQYGQLALRSGGRTDKCDWSVWM